MKTQLQPTKRSCFKTAPSARRNLRMLVFLLFTLLSTTFAFATHFRYGLVTATRLSETSTTVTYRINLSAAWRSDFVTTTANFVISGGNTGSFNITSTSVLDPSGGWANTSGSAIITLNKTSTLTRISSVSGDKITGMVNNSSRGWDLNVILNTAAPGTSPVSTLPAIINMPINAAAATYLLPASDPDPGSTLTYGIPAFTGGLANQTEPPGFSINATTGQITLNTIGKTVGQLYNAIVTVTDNNGNRIMLDFIIKMVGASNPPQFDYSANTTPLNGSTYNVIAGQNISFPIKASDIDDGSTVGLSVSGLPAYITTANFSPAMPATGNPSQTTFSWTPGAAQIGTTNVLNFVATDNVGVQTTSSVTIKVVAEPAPVFIAPSPIQSSIRQIETGVLHQDIITAQSSLGTNVSIAFANVPSGATFAPAVPTSGANPGQTTLSWTPTPANWGQHTLSYQATIAAFPTIFTTLSYDIIVNTSPVFGSFPSQLTVDAGQPFSYNVVISDPDIPYGDVITIGGHQIPSWLTLTSTGNGTAVLSGTPGIADGGVNPVELEAEDIHHHGSSTHLHQEFDIFVVTCIPPAIICPANLTVDAASDANCGALVTYPAATISGSTPVVTYSIPSGGLFPVGTTAVTVTATNDCGTAACTFNVTVVDNTAPAVITQDIIIGLDSNGMASITTSQINNESTDNCSIADYSLNNTTFTCANIGTNTVTLTVTDIHGNSHSANAIVTVQDNIAPIVATQNIVVQLDATGNATITPAQINNGSTDNCSIAGYSLDKTTFTCANEGANTVVLTVTDVNGNSASATATVTVEDNIAPVVLTQNITVTLENGTASITAAQINNGSSDACGIQSLSVSTSSFNCSTIGANTVTLTATDVNGNSASQTATVTVIGEVPSCTITSSPNTSGTVIGSTTTLAQANQMYLGYGPQSMRLTCAANGAAPFTYSWTGSNLSSNTVANPVFTPTAGGNYTFVCTTTNAYGCQTTCSITICVLDIRVAGGSANNQKVYLCHVPPGNPNNAQTLSIAISAVPAHLGNHSGDRLGSCNLSCGYSKGGDETTGELITQEVTNGQVDLIVYPNPSQHAFQLLLESESLDVVDVTIFDISGKTVLELKGQTPGKTIIIDQLTQQGIYIAEVKQGDFLKRVKLNKIN